MSFALPPNLIGRTPEPEIPEPVEEPSVFEELFEEPEKIEEPIEEVKVEEPVKEEIKEEPKKPEPPVFHPLPPAEDSDDGAVIALVKKYSSLHSEYEKLKGERKSWQKEKEELIDKHKQDLESATQKARDERNKEVDKLKALIKKAIYE